MQNEFYSNRILAFAYIVESLAEACGAYSNRDLSGNCILNFPCTVRLFGLFEEPSVLIQHSGTMTYGGLSLLNCHLRLKSETVRYE
jgi:hypothetical protein